MLLSVSAAASLGSFFKKAELVCLPASAGMIARVCEQPQFCRSKRVISRDYLGYQGADDRAVIRTLLGRNTL